MDFSGVRTYLESVFAICEHINGRSDNAVRFSDLTAGDEFPAVTLALDADTVAAYLAATEDDNAVYYQGGALRYVPPLALAALSFRDIARELALEPGSLHTGQELTFRRPVTIGERLTTRARVATSSRRRGFTALAVEIAGIDEAGEVALSGRMTLMVAGAEAEGAGSIAVPPSVPAVQPAEAATEPRAYSSLGDAEIRAGRELARLSHDITQQRIDRYALASGDYNPIHLDAGFAAQTPFGGTVAHGMLLLAYLSVMLTRAFGERWLNSGSLKIKFRQPGTTGATVATSGRVERVEQGDSVQYAVCSVGLENAGGDTLISGEARVEIDVKRA